MVLRVVSNSLLHAVGLFLVFDCKRGELPQKEGRTAEQKATLQHSRSSAVNLVLTLPESNAAP